MHLLIPCLVAIPTVAFAVISLAFIYRSLRTLTFPLTAGVLVASNYFIGIPTLYCAMNGSIDIPIDVEATLLQGVDVQSDAVVMACIMLSCVCISSVCWLLENFTSFATPATDSATHAAKSEGNGGQIAHLIITAALLAIVSLIYRRLSGAGSPDGHWEKSRGEFFDSGGFAAIALVHTNVALLFVYLIKAISYSSRCSNPSLTAMALLIPAGILDTMLRGNRIFLLLYALAVLCLCVYHSRWRLLAASAMCSVPLMLFYSIYRLIRARVAGVASLSDFVSLVQKGVEEEETNSNPLLNAVEYIDYICLVGVMKMRLADWSFQPSISHATFLKPLLTFVPSAILEDKPKTVSVIVGVDLFNATTSWNVLLPGEAILNLWLFGVPIAGMLVFVWFGLPVLFAVRGRASQFVVALVAAFAAFRQPFDAVANPFAICIAIVVVMESLMPVPTSDWESQSELP